MVSEVLKDHTAKDYAAVFMHDIVICSDTEEEHGQHVRPVMDTLWKYNFKAKDRKCTFGRPETGFVGYRVSGDGIRLLEQKISSIIKLANGDFTERYPDIFRACGGISKIYS
jgi:hypothetical protein